MSEKKNHVCEVWYKQKAVSEFLTLEGEKSKRIRELLKVIYGKGVFDVSTVHY